MDFSTKLFNIRVQRNMTQMELAKALGTAQSSIASWEKGRREPDFATVRKIANFFKVPMILLFPTDDEVDEEYIYVVSQTLHSNPKLKALFDSAKFLPDDKLNALLIMAESLNIKAEQ